MPCQTWLIDKIIKKFSFEKHRTLKNGGFFSIILLNSKKKRVQIRKAKNYDFYGDEIL